MEAHCEICGAAAARVVHLFGVDTWVCVPHLRAVERHGAEAEVRAMAELKLHERLNERREQEREQRHRERERQESEQRVAAMLEADRLELERGEAEAAAAKREADAKAEPAKGEPAKKADPPPKK